MPKRHVILALLAATAVAGCSADSPAPGATAPRPKRPLDADSVSTPLDAYLPSAEITLKLHRAEATLVNRCMNHLAYDEHPMPVPVELPRERKHSEFLVFSIRQAKRVGYNLPEEFKKSKDSNWDDAVPKIQRSLLDGTVGVYKGTAVPKRGCVGLVADRLTKNSKIPQRIDGGGVELRQLQKSSPTSLGGAEIGVVRLDAVFAARRNPEYVEMIKLWSSCMSKKGYEYETPEKAMDDRRWRGDDAGADEKRVAVTDMRCKEKVNYLGVASKVQSAYEELVIQKKKTELSRLCQNIEVWQSNADEALKNTDG